MGANIGAAAEADMDQALIDTYAKAGITNDPLTHSTTPPTIGDLYETLLHMGGTGPQLAQMVRKYTTGTFSGIFSNQSNISLDNKMVVFNIRDLEEDLRPVAMYIVLSYIWNKVRSDKAKRMLIIDEAWQLLQFEDSAKFMFSIAKRARKYYLGLTTISQDVEDMLSSKMGRAIVNNSSLQILLKQSPAAVDAVAGTFRLTSEEKKRLTQFPVGQGLFFAGMNHIHIKIDASPTETELITTNPQQLAALNAKINQDEDNEILISKDSRDMAALANAGAGSIQTGDSIGFSNSGASATSEAAPAPGRPKETVSTVSLMDDAVPPVVVAPPTRSATASQEEDEPNSLRIEH